MADVHKFSESVIDMAERLEDVADAMQGKGNRRGGVGTRWLLLPAAGAGLYALATNNSFGRHAKGVIDQAKTRAAELPEDLLGRVRQTSRTQSTTNQGTRQSSSARRSSSRRKTGRSTSKASSSR